MKKTKIIITIIFIALLIISPLKNNNLINYPEPIIIDKQSALINYHDPYQADCNHSSINLGLYTIAFILIIGLIIEHQKTTSK